MGRRAADPRRRHAGPRVRTRHLGSTRGRPARGGDRRVARSGGMTNVQSTEPAAARRPVVFLFDVDNTLLDNDRVTGDLARHLERAVGPDGQKRYFSIFEELRSELGYA